MKTLTVILLNLLFLYVGAQNQQWAVVSSSVKFKIKNAGIMVDGTFSGFNANISFDPEKNFGNKIEASVEAKTVNTGNNSRDSHLRKTDYFSVEKFPKITMSSSVFTKESNGSYKGFFNLTIKGVTKLIPVIFTFTESGGKAKLAGSFKLNRLDYSVGETSWILSNDVEIFIEVNVIKK